MSVVSPQVSVTADIVKAQLSWPLPVLKTGVVAVQATGSFGGGTLTFYGSTDGGTTYYTLGSLSVAGALQLPWGGDGALYYTMAGSTAPTVSFTYFPSSGSGLFSPSVTTSAPTSGTAGTWKLGVKRSSTLVALDTANWIEVDIGGTFYRIATITITTP